ncbi:beta strand repeat-containing protein [Sphingomonas humi]|uniref:RapA2 cadherin-like domain-containing protein n=1 Tax=Sphingomonas humi TaxID=335630 RepID=A0ABP7SED1_9SPHN
MATIKGTNNADTLWGTAGDDNIDGGGGNDTIRGFTGNDTLHGGNGNDTVFGSAGEADQLFGDAGNDKLYGYLGTALVDGGDGNDTAILDLRNFNQGIEFNLADNLVGTARIAGIDIRNVENITINTAYGSARLTGGTGNDTFTSLGGFNILKGMGGNDRLEGGDGVDILDGGSGNDVLLAGAGDDFLIANNRTSEPGKDTGADLLDGGSGYDTASIDRANATTDINFSLADPTVMQVLDNGTTVVNVEAIALFTGKGNDTLTGGASSDWFDAGAGNDTVDAGGGPNTIYGGDGDDLVYGRKGDILLSGGDGADKAILDFRTHNDTVTFNLADNLAGEVIIAGTRISGFETVSLRTGRGDDRLTGGSGGDTLSSEGGLNVMQGMAGNDRLEGGDGVDILDGGSGNDVLLGGAGDDFLISNNRLLEPGKDSGADVIDGGSGFDTASIDRATAASDISFSLSDPAVMQVLDNGTTVVNVEAVSLYTGRGNDKLIGGGANDWFDGGAGNDVIDARGGANTVFAGAGDDIVYGRKGDLLLDGGDGKDSAILDFRTHNTAINFTLADNLVGTVNMAGTDLRNFESFTLRTGRGDARLTGGAGNDTFSAEGGFNLMFGMAGNDRLEGGDGMDYLNGGSGNDVMLGGAGDDTLISNNRYSEPGKDTGVDVIDGGSGNDTAFIDRANATTDITFDLTNPAVRQVLDNGTSVVNVESVELFTGRGNDTLIGGTGRVTFDGGAGDDELIGGSGNDQLYGGSGDDLIIGGAGDDIIEGGDGNDNIGAALGDRVVDGGTGIDYASIDLRGFDGSIDFNLANNLTGTVTVAGAEIRNIEQIYLHTGNGNDVLVGGARDDILASTGGRNFMIGGGGNDLLVGGTGVDTLSGGSDDDRLRGGAGNDTLDGGTGNDVAEFSGSSSDYLVTKTAEGFLIRDLDPAGRDGTDVLISVETLRFADGDFTPAAMVARGSAPVVVADKVTTTENLSGTVNVLANDSDRAGTPLKLVSVTSTDPGLSFGFSASGDVSVTPGAAYQSLAAGQVRTSTASYVAQSATGQQATGSITITVTGENDVPIASSDSFSVGEDSKLFNVNLLGNDTDVDAGARLTVSALDTSKTAGSVTLNADGTVNYDPGSAFQYLASGQTATDSFAYSIKDEFGVGTSAVVTVTIVGADEAPGPVGPVARDDNFTISASEHAVKLTGLLANDIGQGLRIVSVPEFSEAGPTVTLNPDGSVIYDPSTWFDGLNKGQVVTDGFDYTVEDANGVRSTAHAMVTVTGGHEGAYFITVQEDASTGDISTGLLAALRNQFGQQINDLTFDISHTVGTFTAASGAISYAADDPFFDPLMAWNKVVTSVGINFTDGQGAAHHTYLLIEVDGADEPASASAMAVNSVPVGEPVAGEYAANDFAPGSIGTAGHSLVTYDGGYLI